MPARPVPETFLVAFSFAGEQRDLVRSIAETVESTLGWGTVFYDDWFEYYISGDDADLRLQAIYSKRSKLVIPCISERYGGKPWTLAEHRAIRALQMELSRQQDEKQLLRILPLRVGDGDVKGVFENTICPDVRKKTVGLTAELIVDRLRLVDPDAISQAASATPASPRAEIRRGLSVLFDDAAFTIFVGDHFPQIAIAFDPAATMEQKQTQFLNALERNKIGGYSDLLRSLRKEIEIDRTYERQPRAPLEKLVTVVETYVYGTTEPQPAGSSSVALRGRRKPAVAATRETAGARWGSGEFGVIDRLVSSESDAWTETGAFREKALEFLQAMEQFVGQELGKSRDQHFVELSMRLAQADVESSPLLRQSLSMAIVPEGGPKASANIENRDQLHQTVIDERQIVILAPPGSGKTTVLHHYTLWLIRQYRRTESLLIPVFVPLTRYGIDVKTLEVADIVSFLTDQIRQLVGANHLLVDRFRDIAAKGLFLFILDGLDQMPNRRSETARLDRLRSVDKKLRRIDKALKVAGLFRRSDALTMLLETQKTISSQLAPQIDPRERQIERLSGFSPSPAIASCRIHDFVGAPGWQRVEVLPMSSAQIDEFVRAYAPEAFDVIRQQYESKDATRSLVSNPFYLRMLTKAVEEQRRTDGKLPDSLSQVLGRRGLLLSDLIWRAVFRETKDRDEATAIMTDMGTLAHFMLSRNLIGAVPEESLKSQLGDRLERTLAVAQGAGVVEVRQGPPLSMEFNHQLFMEVLLAYHLSHLSQQEGGFERSLELLARQGDRWAETIKLLFEMIPDAERSNRLLDKCVAALEKPATWDIATRVLSDVGNGVSTRVAKLLQHPHELTRRGAARILGRIGAIEHIDRLADLHADPDWPVRRAALEALVELGRVDRLTAFENDPKPLIHRLVCRARILHSADALATILEQLQDDNPSRREQAARATKDVFPQLLKSQAPEALLRILQELINDRLPQVMILGYVTAAGAPFYVRRRLKSEFMTAALESTDRTINYLARTAVVDLLDKDDLEKLRKESDGGTFIGGGFGQDARAARIYWLLRETEEFTSPRIYLESLLSAEPTEIVALTQRLSKRGDQASLGMLTYLLGKDSAKQAAMLALASMGTEGAGHALAALQDPLAQVRLSVAETVKFCHLPTVYRRQVRDILRQNHISRYSVTHQATDPAMNVAAASTTVHVQLMAPFTFMIMATSEWIASSVFRLGIPWLFWARFCCFQAGMTFPGGAPLYYNDRMVRAIERAAFRHGAVTPTAEFWLARGRLLRAIGDLDPARQSLERSLNIDPSLERARFELALVHRSQRETTVAIRTLESDDHVATPGSDNEALLELLHLEATTGAADAEQRLRLLVQLNLWSEAFPLLMSVFSRPPVPSSAYFFLYRTYIGMSRTSEALAAALKNNAGGAAEKVPQVDIDNLRWLHRSEGVGAEVQGELCMLIDFGEPQAIVDFLRRSNVLPAVPGAPLSEENVDVIHDLSPTTREALLKYLDGSDAARAVEMRRALGL